MSTRWVELMRAIRKHLDTESRYRITHWSWRATWTKGAKKKKAKRRNGSRIGQTKRSVWLNPKSNCSSNLLDHRVVAWSASFVSVVLHGMHMSPSCLLCTECYWRFDKCPWLPLPQFNDILCTRLLVLSALLQPYFLANVTFTVSFLSKPYRYMILPWRTRLRNSKSSTHPADHN